ncbi:MAG: hypothetical protein ACTSVU_04180 [Promethearchaeota archaeon]
MINTQTTAKSLCKIDAVALVSGGLDSAIATKLVLEQGLKVVAMNFHSPFCTCSSQGCSAVGFSQKLDIPIKSINKGDDYLRLVKNPKFGYGKNINPCIDCRIHILKKAKTYMEEIGAKFIITGEVLGQRPKSQMFHALQVIEKEAGLEGRILRPLSAKLLKPTIMEQEGIINREKLLGIQGRRRNIQVELGKNYNLIEQYCASGGCRLTDKNFANRLRDYFKFNEDPKMSEMKYLRIGRHFRYDNTKIIVGKDQTENLQLSRWAKENDVVLTIKDIMGPTVLIQSPECIKELEFAAQLAYRYANPEENKPVASIIDHLHRFLDFEIQPNPEIKILIEQRRI